MKEHQRSVRSCNLLNTKTVLSKHVENFHHLNFEQTTVIDIQQNKYKRLMTEIIQIERYKNRVIKKQDIEKKS